MLVKIIPESIKKNPNAGKYNFTVLGNVEQTFTCYGDLPEWIKDGDNCIITETLASEFPVKTCGFILGDPDEWINKFNKQDEAIVEVNVKKDFQHMPCSPQPEYLYEYEDALQKCDGCGGIVKDYDIITDYFYCGDNERDELKICPQCESPQLWEELEYQTIKDALKNKNHE